MSIESTSPSTSILQGGSVVSTANPLQVSLANTAANATAVKVDGTGGTFPISGAVTIADGADVTQGAIADAAVTAGATGSISAKLRSISRDLIANIVLAAGSAIIGKVGIDQTTPATTNAVRNGHEVAAANFFSQVHVPATAVQATKTQASGGGTVRNVCTGFTFTITAGASAPTAAAPLIVSVIDGASGGTTYLWRSYINVPAAAGAQISIVRSNIWLIGSQATAMTCEFSAAGATNTYESVAFDGVLLAS